MTNLLKSGLLNGVVNQRNLPIDAYTINFETEPSAIPAVEKLVVLSDIHGQLDLFQSILKANEIVDEQLFWSFGDGHMVIVGDVFDRGPQVTESFWYIMKLDKQAKEAGGRVHVLLGNHEYMPLQNDLRYVHEKYLQAASNFDTTYPELFSNQTIIGRWLRSKSTIFRIGRRIFVHGGISAEFLDRELSLETANNIYREILDMTKKEMRADPKCDYFYGSQCPIWHRGY
ncbi:MAG: metallophosphoesterase, partial [Cytophagales bacterium]|nr:metallophosphoesterase [Cytophagales bacterium]